MEKDREPGKRHGRSGKREWGHHDEKNEKIEELVRRIREELVDSIEPISIPELNAFERKLIHRQFDDNAEIATKTYRISDDVYELRIYPIGNLKRYAQKKADEAVQTRQKTVLSPMSSYERFIVHDYFKDVDTVKTSSHGEGEDRHIEIEPEVFGRGLKRIIRKIKLR
jgi:predicted RNA-binding protein Jag